ncbi:hypothetical protein ACVNS2_36245 [Paenibacillus caseinilyticus]|nr:hypothetical protein [Paenibacillus mucilaginosus]AFH66137.2 hypothetical protein B2K_36490 [Paenibacillus mucilaginosus K02]WFA22197.1 hypothetical protein ERY13_36010 [Paenibacillus mucilaginosus]
MHMEPASAIFSVMSIFAIIIYLGMLGLFVYAFVLFVKLARRGITALDLYIEEKRGNRLE